MKKPLIAILIISIILGTASAFAYTDISEIIVHFNGAVEDYVPEYETKKHLVFADIVEFDWAHESIYYLVENGIVDGVGEGQFLPDNGVTVKEFSKMLILALGFLDNQAESNYIDVPADDWAYVYISSAKKIGLLDVFPKDELGADKNISREQMAYMAGKGLEIFGCSLDYQAVNKFSDDQLINSNMAKYVYALKNIGIINGVGNNNYSPITYTKRCEAAKIIYSVIKASDKILNQEGEL